MRRKERRKTCLEEGGSCSHSLDLSHLQECQLWRRAGVLPNLACTTKPATAPMPLASPPGEEEEGRRRKEGISSQRRRRRRRSLINAIPCHAFCSSSPHVGLCAVSYLLSTI